MTLVLKAPRQSSRRMPSGAPRRLEVVLTADGREVVLRVADDGVGIPSGGRRSGLRNMAERAEQLGGHLELGSAESGGAVLVWTVPLPEGA